MIKALALILLAIAIAYPDLGGLKSKGIGVRAVVYPLGLVALPLLCWLVRRRRPAVRLDWVADALCSLPILVDLAGNRANLFDTVWWWDDAMHLLMHGVLTAAVLRQFWPRTRGVPLITAAIAFGGLSGLALGAGGVPRVHAVRRRAVRRLSRHARRPVRRDGRITARRDPAQPPMASL